MTSQSNSAASTESALEQVIGEFKDDALLRTALTHRSYAFENDELPHNERLEFLGDSVLGLVITDLIFEEFPNLAEGEMAKVRASTVNMTRLAEVAAALNLGEQLLLGKGEELSHGRAKASILADAFEALLGAMYLDRGLEHVRGFIVDWFGPGVREHIEKGLVRDFKTRFQEEAVRISGELPDYRVSSTGPDHAKKFEAEVYMNGRRLGSGNGTSKKDAEQEAARQALEKISESEDA